MKLSLLTVLASFLSTSLTVAGPFEPFGLGFRAESSYKIDGVDVGIQATIMPYQYKPDGTFKYALVGYVEDIKTIDVPKTIDAVILPHPNRTRLTRDVIEK